MIQETNGVNFAKTWANQSQETCKSADYWYFYLALINPKICSKLYNDILYWTGFTVRTVTYYCYKKRRGKLYYGRLISLKPHPKACTFSPYSWTTASSSLQFCLISPLILFSWDSLPYEHSWGSSFGPMEMGMAIPPAISVSWWGHWVSTAECLFVDPLDSQDRHFYRLRLGSCWMTKNWKNFVTSLWRRPSGSDTNCKSGKTPPLDTDCYSTCEIELFRRNMYIYINIYNCEQSESKISRPTKKNPIKSQRSFCNFLGTCAAIWIGKLCIGKARRRNHNPHTCNTRCQVVTMQQSPCLLSWWFFHGERERERKKGRRPHDK